MTPTRRGIDTDTAGEDDDSSNHDAGGGEPAVGNDVGDADAKGDDWGYGIGSLGPLDLDHVLVTWGTSVELDGEVLPEDRVSVDVERTQLEVTVPIEPGTQTWRHYAVVGLFDTDSKAFVQPTDDRPCQ